MPIFNIDARHYNAKFLKNKTHNRQDMDKEKF